MRHVKITNPCLALSVAALLSACGGDSGTDVPYSRVSPKDYGNLKISPIEAQRLVAANETSLSLHIKNGIRLNLKNTADHGRKEFSIGAVNDAANAESSSRGYSSTNTVEQGVDEADFVKYDGRYLFASTHPYWRWGAEPEHAKIRILETDPDTASAAAIAEIELDQAEGIGSASELYLVSNESKESTGLATLRHSWSYYAYAEPSIDLIASSSDFCFSPQENTVELSVYDLENIEEPQISWSVKIDGFMQTSRKIGNTLYLTTYHSPYIPGLDYFATTSDAQEQNEDLIANADLDDLMPSISINGGEAQPLMNAEDCLLPADINTNHGFAGIASIIAIDLKNREILSTACLSANTQDLYVTQDNLYLGASEWESSLWPEQGSTVIHKFALNNGDISYRSTGSVPGQIDWSSSAFRMQEFDNTIRIVTTWREADNNWRPTHRLTILEDDATSDQMLEVAALPNTTRPQEIGKPNEDIYAVRFYENRAFVVTFERIDPLYIIDLSNPADPFIAGELEIPGLSSYLHPVGQNYLLGVGRSGEWDSQVKVSLFDVSNTENPVELRSIEFADYDYSYTEAEYDHNAISFLQGNADQLRITLPVNFYSYDKFQPNTTLQLLEINGLANNTADLSHVGGIAPDNTREDYWNAISRGVLHDEAVYHVVEGEVFSALWSNPGAATGPH